MKIKNALLIPIFILAFSSYPRKYEYNISALGGFAISIELFEFMLNNIPHGQTILELGSGSATQELAKYYTMYSIEHDKQWLNKYDTFYIYAPIINRWYDVNSFAGHLPSEYAAILIDGPPGPIGRQGFAQHLNLFNTNTMLIFDDVQRKAELNLLKEVAQKLNKSYKVFHCKDGKSFGIINNQKTP